MRQRNNRRSLVCPICQNIFRQVVTIDDCRHRFCHSCIKKKIKEEGLHNCPVCNIDLGSSPFQKLRVDYCWQKVLDKFNKESEFGPKSYEQEINANNMQTTGEGYSSRTRSRSRNEKRKNVCESSSEKMRGRWRWPHQNEEMWDVDDDDDDDNEIVNVASNESRELRARRREEKNPIIHYSSSSTSTRSRNNNSIPTSVECNEELPSFWFSLVASNKQRCRPPLEQIPARYINVKDGNITVSYIKKYLMQKLNLRSEHEVEISLRGRKLFPNIQICKFVDLWMHTAAAPLERKRVFVGSSARDFVLTLTYARSPPISP